MNKIKQEINQRIQQAITLYQQGESKKRFFPYKTPISMCLKVQEWKTKWVPRDSNFKAELEGYFTRLVSLMKAEQGDKLQACRWPKPESN